MRTSSGETRAARAPRHPGACFWHAPPKPIPKAKPAGGPPDFYLPITPAASPRGGVLACVTDRFSHDQGQAFAPGFTQRARREMETRHGGGRARTGVPAGFRKRQNRKMIAARKPVANRWRQSELTPRAETGKRHGHSRRLRPIVMRTAGRKTHQRRERFPEICGPAQLWANMSVSSQPIRSSLARVGRNSKQAFACASRPSRLSRSVSFSVSA